MSQDQNRNPILPSLTKDEQFISADAFSSANSAFDWDTLVSRGGCSNNAQQSAGMSRWERDSLYVKFDPLLNSKKADGGGMGAPVVDDRLSSIFKVPKLPGGLAPPSGGGGNVNMISPVSDSGSSYKSAHEECSSHELLDDELIIPPTNGNLHNCPSPPRHELDQLGKGDAESSLHTADFELATEFLNQEKAIFNETVILVKPTLLEDDKVNGNDIDCKESSSPPPSAPPAPVFEVTDGVCHPENEATPCQNNLLFSPFPVSKSTTNVNSDALDELDNLFKKAVTIGTPVRGACGAVFDLGSGEPVADNDEELKRRAELSISDDSFLEAFSRGVCIKTPARPEGTVQTEYKSPEGDEKAHHLSLNGTFNMTPPSASESLNVTQILASKDYDFDADLVGNGNQNLNLTQPLSQFPVGSDDNNDHQENQDDEEERLDHTAPIIDTSFSEEDDIPTAPNSVEPFPTEEDPTDPEGGCQDIIIEDSKIEIASPPPASPKMNKSLENFCPSPEAIAAPESFAYTSNSNVASSNKSFSIIENGIESSGEGDSNSSSISGPDSQAEKTPTPPPLSPQPKVNQEQLDRIQKLKDQLAQADLEYEQLCRETDEEIAMKEAKLKTITTKVEVETKAVESAEAAVQRATDERDQAIADLKTMEANFADMLGMYENIKSLQIRMEKNCDILKKRELVLVQALQQREERDNVACQIVSDCLEVMKQEFETRVKEREADNLKLKARLRMSEMNVEKMEAKMVQLDRESEKLRALCDDLLKEDVN